MIDLFSKSDDKESFSANMADFKNKDNSEKTRTLLARTNHGAGKRRRRKRTLLMNPFKFLLHGDAFQFIFQ